MNRQAPLPVALFSEITGPIKAKFYMKSHWDGGMKVCSNDPAAMPIYDRKMPAMPIYGKSNSKMFSEISRPMTFELGIQHQLIGPYKVCLNDDPR